MVKAHKAYLPVIALLVAELVPQGMARSAAPVADGSMPGGRRLWLRNLPIKSLV